MSRRNTVRLGYVNTNGQLQRTLIHSDGRVFVAGEWAHHDGAVTPVAPASVFERWNDVPAAWVGGNPPFWT